MEASAVDEAFRGLLSFSGRRLVVQAPDLPLHGVYPNGRVIRHVVDGPIQWAPPSVLGGAARIVAVAPREMEMETLPPGAAAAVAPRRSSAEGDDMEMGDDSEDGVIEVAGGASVAPPSAGPSAAPMSAPPAPLDRRSKLVFFAGTVPLVLPFNKASLEESATLVDWFTERARMAASRKDEAGSTLDLWRTPVTARAVVDGALRRSQAITDASLRRGAWKIATANLFKPHLAKTIYELLGARRVLDMCAGWGCRLIGAMGTRSVERYIGFDPNPALVEGHQGALRHFRPLTSGRYDVIMSPFEDAVAPLIAPPPPPLPLPTTAALSQPVTAAEDLGEDALPAPDFFDETTGGGGGTPKTPTGPMTPPGTPPPISSPQPPAANAPSPRKLVARRGISVEDVTKGFDVAFTSPPYFDLEDYEPGASGKQSIARYPRLNDWLEKWCVVAPPRVVAPHEGSSAR
jgi:hypothetical protein